MFALWSSQFGVRTKGTSPAGYPLGSTQPMDLSVANKEAKLQTSEAIGQKLQTSAKIYQNFQ